MKLLHISGLTGYFNSQPHEEADWRTWLSRRIRSYFNSQPHEEADRRQDCLFAASFISTHSLTKRLTRGYRVLLVDNDISTHSLTKRLTGTTLMCLIRITHFNSQPHEEADYFQCMIVARHIPISTHSLTKRLTAISHKNF